MSPLELIEAIQMYYKNSHESIRGTSDIISAIYERDITFANALESILETESLSEGLCMLCGDELEERNERLECINPVCTYSTTIPY